MRKQGFIRRYVAGSSALAIAPDPVLEDALRQAVAGGDEEAVDVFLRSGADPDMRYDDGRTLLMEAAANGSNGIVERLLGSGADPNAVDYRFWTALLWAVVHGKTETVRRLLDAGARTTDPDCDGNTIEHIAHRMRRQEILTLLRGH